MNVRIERGTAYGEIQAPPSKSYGHRMLICAALSQGKSIVRRISSSEDMLATIDCIQALGGNAGLDNGICTVEGIVRGALPDADPSHLPVFRCRESGSTLRFFIPIAMALTGGGIFAGSRRLIERGIDVYEEIFAPLGAEFEYSPDSITVRGSLNPGNYRVRGDVSSQFVTGLLFALPLLEGDSTLEIIPPVESRPYIDITIDAMRQFGVNVSEPRQNHFVIPGWQCYRAADITVEGDWSNAAFLYAIRKLAAPDGLNITGLNDNSIQGDRICLEYFDRLMARSENKNIAVEYGTQAVAADETLDLSECPDLGPALFAFAAAVGGGRFTGIKRLRIKESDRAAAMAEELARFGIQVIVADNDMEVIRGKLKTPAEAADGHNDHRIVMAVAVLMLLTGGEIRGAEAVNKSYPEFWSDLNRIGIRTEEIDK